MNELYFLSDIVYDAVESAFTELFETNKNENFYYCTLLTSGQASPPYISAWSWESLAESSKEDVEDEHFLKWSNADSPYCCFGNEHFSNVSDILEGRVANSLAETEFRIEAMMIAMKKAIDQGGFGSKSVRANRLINVEVVPPDYTNVTRAYRLNPKEALTDWLNEAAEPNRFTPDF